MWVVNVSVVTLLPSNGALMGPNGLPVWLCNYLECLFVLKGPVSPSGVTDPFTRQYTFVLVISSEMCVCLSVLSTLIPFVMMSMVKMCFIYKRIIFYILEVALCHCDIQINY